MKKLANPINLTRLYEITGFHPDDSYTRDNSELVGIIIKPAVSLRPSESHLGCYAGPFHKTRTDKTTKKTGYFHAAYLRPLTQKEQAREQATS